MKKKKNNKIVYTLIAILLLVIASVFGINLNDKKVEEILSYINIDNIFYNNDEIKKDIVEDENNLYVHFIDVGQADAILLQKGNEYALIDAGCEASENDLKKYLENKNVSSIKYLFLTHAHEDHIGGADMVISNYNISNVIFPKTTANTVTYEKFVDSVLKKNLKIEVPNIGNIYDLNGVKIEVLSPKKGSIYENQNNYSLVLKVVYNNISYLLTGDAESLVENEMLTNNLDLNATVLKLGHHGSRTSSSKKFLEAVNPKYAIISVGKNNDYSHPHEEVMKRLSILNVEIYRTDELGSIVSITDGNGIKFINKKER